METWCASPKGCYKTTDPVTGETATNNGISQAPALPDGTEETNPLQSIIDHSIDYFVNASAGKLLQILFFVVVAIVVLVVIKNLMVAGVAKAKSFDASNRISNAGKAYAEEKHRLHNAQVKAIAEAKKNRRSIADSITNDADYGHAFNALEAVLENGKSFYEREIAKQDNIQSDLEESLANSTKGMQTVDMGAPDLSLKSLRTYDDETKDMFTTKSPDRLFAEYNKLDELAALSYNDIPDVDYSAPAEYVSAQERKLQGAKKLVQQKMSDLVDESGEAIPRPPSLPRRKQQ